MKRFFAGLISALSNTTPEASPPEKPARDYSHVTSREAAEKLAAEGELFKILLFPEEFGGENEPENVVYVPAGIPEIKDQITGSLIRFYEDGLIDRLTVMPEYKGNSFVPSRIAIKASHSAKSGRFEPTIEIW